MAKSAQVVKVKRSAQVRSSIGNKELSRAQADQATQMLMQYAQEESEILTFKQYVATNHALLLEVLSRHPTRSVCARLSEQMGFTVTEAALRSYMAAVKKSGEADATKPATGHSASARETTNAIAKPPEPDEVEVIDLMPEEVEVEAPAMEAAEVVEVTDPDSMDEAAELEDDAEDIDAELESDESDDDDIEDDLESDIDDEVEADEAELEEQETELPLPVEIQQDLPNASSEGTPLAPSSRRRSSAAKVAYE